MPPAEVLTWYAVADIFVLPSLSEGRPTVINEAMATGCAIVATDISGIP
jgi:glycosyltransferase involved in cell wall biosynthesis